MKESLFSYLVSYVPTDKRESKEDYLTQMFAWILINVEDAVNIYVQYLCQKGNIPYTISDNCEFDISTQTTVPSGRIDLLINVGKEIAFLCEHKVHSELSENQIAKYMNDAKLLGNERYYSVLLTYTNLQHTQKADVSIIWSDVYDLFESHLEEFYEENAFVIKQFLRYLSENGMGKQQMITPEALLGYWPAQNLQYKLDTIFRQISEMNFSELCPGIEKLGNDYEPKYNKNRWGRIGIDFFKTWNLGLFAGVILHNADHHLWPLDVDKGPDFVVFLESDYSKSDIAKREIYLNNIHSDRYLKLKQKLSVNHGEYEFLPGIKESPWRVAVLRRPLFDILYGTTKQTEQVEAIKAAIVDCINMYIDALE